MKKTKKGKGGGSTYGLRYFGEPVPKDKMPEKGMPADAAYQLIKDELQLDGNPALNLATFVTTWMEPHADKLIEEARNKNFIDHDEYPKTEELEQRVVQMLAELYNAPKNASPTGVSTVGSSEAVMLGLLAHKWNWRNRMKKKGKPTDKPNIVMSADVHVVWEKFARYFDVEMRLVPMQPNKYTMTARDVEKNIDENTICVGVELGSTFTGQMDPIEDINKLLLKVKKTKGWDIPIHVDGASGGFVVPFSNPKIKWDFRLEQVKSVNVSGHKYGLVYPGVGWLVLKDKSVLPKDLIFEVNYLGGVMPTYTLNFSKGSSMVIAQYYNFLRLGKAGYGEIMHNIMDNAKYLMNKLVDSRKFEVVSAHHVLPVLAVKLRGNPRYTVFDLSEKLRAKGWITPAYTLPPNAEKIAVFRIVVKENFSRDMADVFFKDIIEACNELSRKKKPSKALPKKKGRHHHIC